LDRPKIGWLLIKTLCLEKARALWNNWIPALSGLLGVLTGASASVVTMLIQSKIHDKRERIRLTKELAIHDFERVLGSGLTFYMQRKM